MPESVISVVSAPSYAHMFAGVDPGAAVLACLQYLHRIAGRIKRQQNKRAQAWRRKNAEAMRQGRSPLLLPDLQRGLGARLDTPTRW